MKRTDGLIYRITLPLRRWWWHLQISFWDWQLEKATEVANWAWMRRDKRSFELALRAIQRRISKLHKLGLIDPNSPY